MCLTHEDLVVSWGGFVMGKSCACHCHCVCTCVAFVFKPGIALAFAVGVAMLLALQWCCAWVALVSCMLRPIRVLEGDVVRIRTCFGTCLLWCVAVVFACGCIAWNCIVASCVALNVVQMHLLALQLRNGCRCLAKQSLRNRNCSRSIGGTLGMVIGLVRPVWFWRKNRVGCAV